MFQRRPPPKSLECPLKILFDHPGEVSIWRPGDVPKQHPGYVLRGIPRKLIRDVARRCSQDVPWRSFKTRLWDDVGSFVECLKNSFYFSFRTYSIGQICIKAIQYSRCISKLIELLNWSFLAKLENGFYKLTIFVKVLHHTNLIGL